MGSIGVGDGVSFFRFGAGDPGGGIPHALDAAVFAQLELGTPSADLLDAGRQVGLPLTFRVGSFLGPRARPRVRPASSSSWRDELVPGPAVEPPLQSTG